MAFPHSVISDLVATTIEYRSKDIADNVTSHNAALRAMKKSGTIETFDGGTEIREHFSFAENTNAGSYSGYDILPTGQSDVLSGASFQMKQYAVPVTFSGREMLTNSGKEQLISLVKERVKVAESTLENLLNRHIYLDGTGNNGNNITGLAAAVPLANATGTYGGIDRSSSIGQFWRNQKFQASVDGSGVATSSNIQAYFNAFFPSLCRNADKPNIIILGQGLFSLYETSLQTYRRIMSVDSADAGYMELEYKGIPVVFETTASGLASTTGYFLNTKYLKWRPHKDRNFVALDDKQSVNQDATVKTLVWAGNMTCSGAKFQGIFSNT